MATSEFVFVKVGKSTTLEGLRVQFPADIRFDHRLNSWFVRAGSQAENMAHRLIQRTDFALCCG